MFDLSHLLIVMEETSSAKKRPEASQPLGKGEELATKKRKRGKIVVKYVEENHHERELWRNYYVLDYRSKSVKQSQFLLNKSVKENDSTCLITMQRSAEVDEDALKREFRGSTLHKGSKCYSIDGVLEELPHYRDVHQFCDENDINNIASMKQKPRSTMNIQASNVFSVKYLEITNSNMVMENSCFNKKPMMNHQTTRGMWMISLVGVIKMNFVYD